MLGSSLTLVKERAHEAGVAIVCSSSSNVASLYVDERKLKKILINLLSNVIKFTLSGGRVTVKSWFRKNNGYVFQVANTGISIALADIPLALTPFLQVDSALNRKYEGSGLGLPLTKALVELHGGSLGIQSEVGVGTTVTVRFSGGVDHGAVRRRGRLCRGIELAWWVRSSRRRRSQKSARWSFGRDQGPA